MSWECIGQKLLFLIDLPHLTFISNPVTQVRTEWQKNANPATQKVRRNNSVLQEWWRKFNWQVGQRGWEKHKGLLQSWWSSWLWGHVSYPSLTYFMLPDFGMLFPPCIPANVSVSSCSSRTLAFHETQLDGYAAVATLQNPSTRTSFHSVKNQGRRKNGKEAVLAPEGMHGQGRHQSWFPSPRAIFLPSNLPCDPPKDRSQFCMTSSGGRDANTSIPAELHLLPSLPCIFLTHECYEMPQSTSGMSLTTPTSPQQWQFLTGLLSIVSESFWDESDC